MTAALKQELVPPSPIGVAPSSSEGTPDPKALPYDSLTRVRSVIPRPVCLPNHAKALFYTLVGVGFMGAWAAASYFVFTAAFANPLYLALWPLTWLVGGMAFTSFFVLGHDCGHQSFLRSKKLMNVIGHIFLAPGLYPYWAWKYSHDAHHQHTNNMKGGDGIYYDNAWIPLTPLIYKKLKKADPKMGRIYKISRWAPPLGSWFHLSLYHYKPSLFKEGEHRKNVQLSLAFLAVALGSFAVSMFLWAGPVWGLVAVLHFWLLPAFFLHMWMATYTFLHHTAEDTQFYDDKDWTPFKGQVENTLNVYFPRWVSFLHFNIDVHVPHHILQTIPSYHLRAANQALLSSEYGREIKERKFTFGYYADAVKKCQLWDRKKKVYLSFADADA